MTNQQIREGRLDTICFSGRFLKLLDPVTGHEAFLRLADELDRDQLRALWGKNVFVLIERNIYVTSIKELSYD